jgi:hypothetical protein
LESWRRLSALNRTVPPGSILKDNSIGNCLSRLKQDIDAYYYGDRPSTTLILDYAPPRIAKELSIPPTMSSNVLHAESDSARNVSYPTTKDHVIPIFSNSSNNGSDAPNAICLWNGILAAAISPAAVDMNFAIIALKYGKWSISA